MDLDPYTRQDRHAEPLRSEPGYEETSGAVPWTSGLRSTEVRRVDIGLAIQVLRAGWRLAGIIALGTVALVAAVAFSKPNVYTARSSFLPPSGGSSMGALAGELSLLSGSAGLLPQRNTGDTYIGILSSTTLADKLIDRFHLMAYYKVRKQSVAEAILASQSKFELGVRDGILTVKVTDRSPELARDIANGYLDELHTLTGGLAITEAAQRRLFFEQQLQQEKDRLAEAEVALRQVQESTGLVAPSGQTQLELQTIAQTRAQISSRQVELAGLRASATDQNRAVIRLHNEIADLQGQLARLEQGGGKGDATVVPAAKVPQAEMEYVRRERDVKYHEALFDMLAKQYEAARLSESHDAPVLQVLDIAKVPDTKSGPPRSLMLGVSLILGVLLGVAYVLVRDRSWMLAVRS